MDHYQPHQINITDRLVEEWIDAEVNVLIQGEYGVGKTSIITNVWNKKIGERNKDWVSFSGATIDPWIDLIGIPRVAKNKNKSQQEDFIEYILPKSITTDLKAIFIDELNRTKPAVLNALMELIQFKSINGRKFPNLKFVWGAINPHDENDENSYHVERLDKAQMDRFHVIVEMPYTPSRKYFAGKLGKNKADMLINWWDNQGSGNKNVSPRRLEYAINYISKGGDAKHVLPKNVNTVELTRILSSNSYEAQFIKFFNDSNEQMLNEYLSDEHRFENVKSLIVNDSQYWETLRFLPQDIISKILEENLEISSWASKSSIVKINECVKEIIKTKSALGKRLQKQFDLFFPETNAKSQEKIASLDEIFLQESTSNDFYCEFICFLVGDSVFSSSVANKFLNKMDNKSWENVKDKINDLYANVWDFDVNQSNDISAVINITSYVIFILTCVAKKQKLDAATIELTTRLLNLCLMKLQAYSEHKVYDKVVSYAKDSLLKDLDEKIKSKILIND